MLGWVIEVPSISTIPWDGAGISCPCEVLVIPPIDKHLTKPYNVPGVGPVKRGERKTQRQVRQALAFKESIPLRGWDGYINSSAHLWGQLEEWCAVVWRVPLCHRLEDWNKGGKNVLSLFLDMILTLKMGSSTGKIQSFNCTSELNFTYLRFLPDWKNNWMETPNHTWAQSLATCGPK